ncbi:MAG: hypothetical protein ABW150_19900 [Candidatus Thiodiazotropha sp.]
MNKIYISDRCKEVKDKEGNPLFIYDANIFLSKEDKYPASCKHFSSEAIEEGHYALIPNIYVDQKGLVRYGRSSLRRVDK